MSALNQACLVRLLNIVRDVQFGTTRHCAFTTGDFCYRWQTETDCSSPVQVRVWSDEASIDRGFAWLSGSDLHLAVRAGEESLFAGMLDWSEEVARNGNPPADLQVPVAAGTVALERELTARGYRPDGPALIQRSRSLAVLPESREIAAGYAIGTVSRPAQIEGWAAAYRRAFAPEQMTAKDRRDVNRNRLYRPDLDLIASVPDDTVVAFALVWLDDDSKIGTFEPLGCVPEHRRRGLTRALMIEGLSRLRELGASRAFVTTTRQRQPANALYESLGFRFEKLIRTWRRGTD